MKKNIECSVSVIIPFYNASSSIYATLTSVFEQTLLPNEIIIVDDCSNECESSLLKRIVLKFEADPLIDISIKLFTLSVNKGASYARNFAIEHSNSTYLAFLDSDDVWASNKIEIQFNYMEKNNLFMTGHGYIFDLNVEKFIDEDFSVSKINRFKFIYTNPFFTPTVMIKRDGFKSFDPSFRRVDDYKCWLENFQAGSVVIIHNKLAGGFKHPIGAGGLTGSLTKMHISYIRVLKSLYRDKQISFQFFYLARLVELLKYPLRIIRTKF